LPGVGYGSSAAPSEELDSAPSAPISAPPARELR
jgi:hypothetical protein